MAMSPYEALRTGTASVDLRGRGKIRVTGEDRARLLHAMSTNHVQNLPVNAGQYTFFLNAQGRILADARVFNFGESLLLETEPELRAKILEHLDRYIIADDVTLEDETSNWTSIGLEGPASAAFAGQLGIPVPSEPLGIAPWGNGFVLRLSVSGGEGVELVMPDAEWPTLQERLNVAGIPQASAEELRVVRLEHGLPRYGEDVTERFLVQETGLLHAVHFSKGCYLGQEIVERVRSRAQIHRHLRRLRVHGTAPLAAGTKLTKEGQVAAEITSAAFSPAWNEVAALGYVRTDAAEPGTVLTVVETDPPVTAEVL